MRYRPLRSRGRLEHGVGIDQAGETEGLQSGPGQQLPARHPGVRLADEGMVVGKGRADRTAKARWPTMVGQEADGASIPPGDRHGDVIAHRADQVGEAGGEQRAGEGRSRAHEVRPCAAVGGAQVARTYDVQFEHGGVPL